MLDFIAFINPTKNPISKEIEIKSNITKEGVLSVYEYAFNIKDD